MSAAGRIEENGFSAKTVMKKTAKLCGVKRCYVHGRKRNTTGERGMYKKSSTGWLKHLDFMILDIICLQLAFIMGFF